MRRVSAAFLICLVIAAFRLVNAQQPGKPPCPTLKLDGPSTEGHGIGVPLVFSVAINGSDPAARHTFNWSVSAGKIGSGQGTPSIVVETDGLIFYCLTVTVEIEGLGQECAPKAAWKSLIGTCCIHFRRKFDEYTDMPFKDEKLRLDNVAMYLNEESEVRVRIFGDDGDNMPKGTAAKRVRRARDYLIKKGIAPDRIVTGPKYPEFELPFERFALEFWIEPIKELVTQPCN